MAEAIEQVNLTEVPNFEALEAWVAKLQDWCEQARDEVVDGIDLETHQRALSELEEARYKSDHFDSFVELFFDMRRGMREPGEIEAWLKDRGFEA